MRTYHNFSLKSFHRRFSKEHKTIGAAPALHVVSSQPYSLVGYCTQDNEPDQTHCCHHTLIPGPFQDPNLRTVILALKSTRKDSGTSFINHTNPPPGSTAVYPPQSTPLHTFITEPPERAHLASQSCTKSTCKSTTSQYLISYRQDLPGLLTMTFHKRYIPVPSPIVFKPR